MDLFLPKFEMLQYFSIPVCYCIFKSIYFFGRRRTIEQFALSADTDNRLSISTDISVLTDYLPIECYICRYRLISADRGLYLPIHQTRPIEHSTGTCTKSAWEGERRWTWRRKRHCTGGWCGTNWGHLFWLMAPAIIQERLESWIPILDEQWTSIETSPSPMRSAL